MRNPFRSEADAFRLLLLTGGGVLAILVAFAIGGSWVGGVVTLAVLAVAGRASYRWIRMGLADPDTLKRPPG